MARQWLAVVTCGLSLLVVLIVPPPLAAAQDLQATCPIVKAAVCTGQCSTTAPSVISSGTCSQHRRHLLLAASDTTAARSSSTTSSTTTTSSSTATGFPPPRPDWKLQRAPDPPHSPSKKPPTTTTAHTPTTSSPLSHISAAAATDTTTTPTTTTTSTMSEALDTAPPDHHHDAILSGDSDNNDIPQRYLPYGNSPDSPPETPEQQEAIRQHLDQLLMSNDNNSSSSSSSSSTATAGGSGSGGEGVEGETVGGEGGGVSEVYTAGEGEGDAGSVRADAADATGSEGGDAEGAAATEEEQHQQQPQQQQQHLLPTTWLWPFKFGALWHHHYQHRRRLQQATIPPATLTQDTAQPPSDTPPAAGDAAVAAAVLVSRTAGSVTNSLTNNGSAATAAAAVGVSSPPSGVGSSSSSSSSVCPAGTVINAGDGTCSSSADAFPAPATQEAAVISTLTLPAVTLSQPPSPSPSTPTTTLQQQQQPPAAAADIAGDAVVVTGPGSSGPDLTGPGFREGSSSYTPSIDPGSTGSLAVGPDGLPLIGSAATAGGDGEAESVTSKGERVTTVTATTTTSRATTAAASYSGPTSQVSRTLTMISNSKIKVGVDLERGGTISYLSSPLAPTPWTSTNLINNWDQGRLLQQSYYGCVDGSCWASRPWLWNPVQGGSWQNMPGLTTRKLVKAGGYIYAEGLGRNWGGQELVQDVKLTTNVSLWDNVAVVKFSMAYSGSTTHPYMTQEVPAVFVDRKFSVLAYYDSTKPWTGDRAIKYAFPPGRNIYARPTESWAAYIDPLTGWGLGVYNPKAWMGITAYRIGPDGSSSRPWDCSYFAHTIRMQLHPGMKPYPYTIYVAVGRLDTIRATFYKLRTQPAVLAAAAATTDATRSVLSPPITTTATDTTDAQLGGTLSGTSAAAASEGQQVLSQQQAEVVLGPRPGQPDLGRNAWYGQPLQANLFDNVLMDGQQASSGVLNTADASQQGSADGGAGRQNPGSVGGSGGGSEAGQLSAVEPLGSRQLAGIVVGAVAACVVVAGAVVIRRNMQRMQRLRRQHAEAAASSSERELLSGGEGGGASPQAAAGATHGQHAHNKRQHHHHQQQHGEDGAVASHEQVAVAEVGGTSQSVTATCAPGATTRSAAALKKA